MPDKIEQRWRRNASALQALDPATDVMNPLMRIRQRTGVGGVHEVLHDAAAKGQKRGRGEFDVFVHPEFPHEERATIFLHYLRNSPFLAHAINIVLRVYTDALRNLFLQARPPAVLLCASEDEPFKKSYNRKNHGVECEQIRAVTIRGPREVETGKMSPEGVAKFSELTNGVHPKDALRVHGATLGACTTEFAQQWFCMSHLGVLLPAISWADAMAEQDGRPLSKEGNDIRSILKMIHRFALLQTKTRVRLGTVFDISGNIPFILKLNPVTAHIMDAKTRVIPQVTDAIRI